VADREDLVVKALSWALRALARRDPAARVIREVENKLTTGRKNPRR
jgi:3-methyladenine DNA glycosylase AlkD